MRRVLAVGAAVLAALLGLARVVGAYEPAPVDCATLLRQAEQTSDVATLIEEGGCLSTPAADIPRP